jgi:hypothetical protein
MDQYFGHLDELTRIQMWQARMAEKITAVTLGDISRVLLGVFKN